VSEEKKPKESKENKFKEVFEKFKEKLNNLIAHQYIEKNLNYISFSLILLILIIVRLQNPEFVKSISSISFDSYQKIFKYNDKQDDIVIVDIDEPSLAKFGQFPWGRNVFSKILENINKENPKSIGFDIFFSEKDKQSPEEIIKTYLIEDIDIKNALQSIEGHDEKFQKTLKETKSVLAVFGSLVPTKGTFNRKGKARIFAKGGNVKNYVYNYKYSLGSIPILEKNSKGLGSINYITQSDAVVRSLPLIMVFNDKLFPSFGLEMIRVGEKKRSIITNLNDKGIKNISIKPFVFNTDKNSLIWVKYNRSINNNYISAEKVFDNNFDDNLFKDKYVLIGASAKGLFDTVKIPTGETIPGVQVHANVIDNLLKNNFLKRNDKIFIFELIISILISIIAFVISQRIKPKYSLSIIFLGLIFIFVIGLIIYKFRSELIDVSYPMIMISITFLTGLYFRFLQENKIALQNLQKEAKLLKERELAGGVQKSLFPDISAFENFVYAKNIPARDVSGDYFDVMKVGPEEYYFTLADVSGKGVKAGMYMAKASSIFRTLSNLKFPLERVVFGVNNEIIEAKFKGMFVTAVFGKFNPISGDLTYINAGHESIMLFDKSKKIEFIESDLPPIGIMKYFAESMVKSKTINIKDKTFVVYTDGVTEGYLPNGEEFGAVGVENIVKEMDIITPKELVEKVTSTLNWGIPKLRDDITCMVINFDNPKEIEKKKKHLPKKKEN
jgi:CHASE2 domain-containing sensor protein|tara:strand:- start:7052 stop:9229 length:2178 start_codon:yes stop_codon:yes gene_type:complete